MPVCRVSVSVIPLSDLKRESWAIRARAYDNGFLPLTGDKVPRQLRGSLSPDTYYLGQIGKDPALLFLSGDGVYAITLLAEETATEGRIEQVPILQSRLLFGKAPEDFGSGSALSKTTRLLAELSYVDGNLS